MASYKVLVGIDYGDKRAEVGDIVSDLPAKSVSWLKEQGLIEDADEKPSRTKKSEVAVEESEEE